VIEIVTVVVVAAGAASATGVGSLAWWTSGRYSTGRADAIVTRAVGAGRHGVGQVVQGEVIGETTPPTSSNRACGGRLVRHADGQTTCHGGRDDCWPGITAYGHQGKPRPCGEQSHGCGSCQGAGWAS